MAGLEANDEDAKFEIFFRRLNGEVITLRDLTAASSMENVRRSILQQLPTEPHNSLIWFFFGGMPCMNTDGTLADNGIRALATLNQYRPDPETMARLALTDNGIESLAH